MRFDKHVVESTLEIGDRVLVRQVRLRGKHKLADKWEPSAYIVVRRAGELPVYTVRPEGKEGSVRTLHRDLLLPCGFLPVASEMVSNSPKPVSKPRTRQQSRDENSDENGAEENTESMEDEVPEYWLTIPTVEKSHGEASATLTPTLHLPVGCDPQVPSIAPGDEHLPVVMDPAGHEACLDNSHTQMPDIMNQLTESDKMLEEDELSENQLSGNLPESPAEEEQNGNEVEIGEETEIPVDSSSNAKRIELSQEPECLIRRSQRQREKPERLQYRELGNPLVSVAQALFHGLTTAFTNSLNGLNLAEAPLPPTFDVPITSQPIRANATGRA
ncbi:uncharacterized protein [Pseudorasbora parva]|uniref:uncharacterized protein n=1 Tax=Pseudorasbora parva TaxID=51549 RepID=UPI00351EE4D6